MPFGSVTRPNADLGHAWLTERAVSQALQIGALKSRFTEVCMIPLGQSPPPGPGVVAVYLATPSFHQPIAFRSNWYFRRRLTGVPMLAWGSQGCLLVLPDYLPEGGEARSGRKRLGAADAALWWNVGVSRYGCQFSAQDALTRGMRFF